MIKLLPLLLLWGFGRGCEVWRGEKIDLVVGFFLPNVPWRQWSPSVHSQHSLQTSLRPAIEIAKSHLKNDPCLLRGYNLILEEQDSQCRASHGMKQFFDLMSTTKRRKVGLFGDACTTVNEPLALTAKYWNMVQLSYAETHPMFASEDAANLYPTFYRMVPGDRDIHNARFRFLQHFNWTRVGTLKQSDNPRFALPHEAFTTQLPDRYDINVIHTGDLSSEKPNIVEALNNLKENDARIIIGDFNSSFAGRVFCEAFHQRLYGPNYVWILPGYLNDNWWREYLEESEDGFLGEEIPTTNCTNSEYGECYLLPSSKSCSKPQLIKAMQGHFIMEAFKTRPDLETPLLSDQTVEKYRTEYGIKCDRAKCDPTNHLHAYVYDGLWAFALALDQVTKELSDKFNVPVPADPKIANESWFAGRLLSALNQTSFQGITGKIEFRDNARVGQVRIAQFQNESYTTVGEYEGTEGAFRLFQARLAHWKVPLDQTRIEERREHVSSGLYFAMSVLACAGMLLALVFLALNIRFRNHKFIRMSSPNLNNLIIVGSIFCYVSVLLLGLDTRHVGTHGFAPLCYAKVWVLCIGFTLAFGSMFSKTWRVHSIFTNIKLNKKAIKDYQLFLIVGILLLLDAVILGLWALLSPTKLLLSQSSETIKDEVRNMRIIPVVEICSSSFGIVFQGTIYGGKGLLLVLGLFLAWETRQVNVPALNDSKYIGMSVYNVVLMCILGVSLTFILEKKVNESYALISLFIIFSTTLTLCLVFGPKAFELIRNPKGIDQKRYKQGMMKSATAAEKRMLDHQQSFGEDEDPADRIVRLQQDNMVWKQHLEEKTKEFEALRNALRSHGEAIPSDCNSEVVVRRGGETEMSTSTIPEDPIGAPHRHPDPRMDDVTEETSLLPHWKEPDDPVLVESESWSARLPPQQSRPAFCIYYSMPDLGSQQAKEEPMELRWLAEDESVLRPSLTLESIHEVAAHERRLVRQPNAIDLTSSEEEEFWTADSVWWTESSSSTSFVSWMDQPREISVESLEKTPLPPPSPAPKISLLFGGSAGGGLFGAGALDRFLMRTPTPKLRHQSRSTESGGSGSARTGRRGALKMDPEDADVRKRWEEYAHTRGLPFIQGTKEWRNFMEFISRDT